MSSRFARLTTVALTVAAIAGPSAAASAAIPSDQHVFPGRGITPVVQDVRSPDARDVPGAAAAVVATQGLDLRTPDARDGTRVTAPDVPVAKTPVSVPASDGNDLGWAQITLGAAALFLLAGMAVTGRRRHSPTPV
jgi:hypothetical protein